MLLYKDGQLGFTLLEVLLALAIMTVLSLSGYLILDGVIRAEAQQKERLEKLRQLQRAIVIIDEDFQQIIPRTSRNGTVTYPMLSTSPNWLTSDSGRVSFIRGGWSNPRSQFNRTNLQQVAYRTDSGKLERLYWSHLDINYQKSPSVNLSLLESVRSLKVEVFHQGSWTNHWENSPFLPEAIRITITFNNKKSLQRSYKIL